MSDVWVDPWDPFTIRVFEGSISIFEVVEGTKRTIGTDV